jgi:hypothetical protein
MKSRLLVIAVCALSAMAWARDWRQMRDEVDRDLPPNVKWYLEQREKKDWFLQPGPFAEWTRMPDSQGLRLVGKWGRGPANKVTGRDSLVFMSLGSEVAIFNAADGSNPRVIAEIQCRNMTGRVCLKDSLLFVGSQGPVEVYSVANPAQPRFISYGPVVAPEISVQDSLVYALGSDSLFIYNVTNPANWQRVGATRDSGYSLNVADGFAYLADRWGLYIVDCTDPTNPHRAGTLSGGVETRASCAEGSYCYYAETYPSDYLVIADVSDPYHPAEIGRLSGYSGFDIQKRDFYVYLPGFAIIDVSIPSSPTVISNLIFSGDKYGIWTRSPYSHSFVASAYEGLTVVDISDPVHPAVTTTIAGADEADDLSLVGTLACVANYQAGMKVVNVGDPALPMQIGSYDTTGHLPYARAVASRDSMACLAVIVTAATGFRVLDLSDPRHPVLAAVCEAWNPGRAISLRDSLAYVAEDYRLEIFSVANPRAPRLVGSCGLPNASGDLWLVDTLAYVTSLPTQIINVSNPANPVAIGSISQSPLGICVQDTFAYLV